MLVAIHQPNYFPWLGYFYKIWAADAFVFLDNVQFTKNGYINRSQIQNGEKNRWLTVPVSVHLGDPISRVMPANDSWRRNHIDLLCNSYREATHFGTMMPFVEEVLLSAPTESLAEINRHTILRITDLLEIDRYSVRSSEVDVDFTGPTDRLIKLTQSISAEAVYLSGKGGANYQDEELYQAAGIGFEYASFSHPTYDQGTPGFVPGRSILDALFHVGLEGTRTYFPVEC
jgi:hypothetical protein